MPLGGEVVEGAVHIAQRRAAVDAVEDGGDVGLTTGLQLPGASEAKRGAGLQDDLGERIVLHPVRAVPKRFAADEQARRDVCDRRKIQRPQCKVD
jgi:hypothetical protein